MCFIFYFCSLWGSNPRLQRDYDLNVAPQTTRPRLLNIYLYKIFIYSHPRRDSNPQSHDSQSHALSVGPRGLIYLYNFKKKKKKKKKKNIYLGSRGNRTLGLSHPKRESCHQTIDPCLNITYIQKYSIEARGI